MKFLFTYISIVKSLDVWRSLGFSHISFIELIVKSLAILKPKPIEVYEGKS